jgi:hypothetical protein
MSCSKLLATCSAIAWVAALTTAPAYVHAAPPERTTEPTPPQRSKQATTALVSGGILIGLGFAAELSGAVISTRCSAGDWCSAGFSTVFGAPNGPNRYTLISTGPATAYIGGRLVAVPLLISGFTLTMVGLSRSSASSDRRRRRLGAALLGSGLGVLVSATILRGMFLSTGTCQEPSCVYGFDQTSLWIGRGLTFAGTGLVVQGAAHRMEFGVNGGPSNSFGASLEGRF